MTERQAIVIGLGAHLAIASALSSGRGREVLFIDLESDLSKDPEFGWIDGLASLGLFDRPSCMGKTDSLAANFFFDEPAIVRAARRLGEPAPRPVYRNRFLNPVEKAEVIHPEVPLTKRQRRRMKGKK